jgi:hypothetical protein
MALISITIYIFLLLMKGSYLLNYFLECLLLNRILIFLYHDRIKFNHKMFFFSRQWKEVKRKEKNELIRCESSYIYDERRQMNTRSN